MNNNYLNYIILLFVVFSSTSHVNTIADQIEMYESNGFTLGIGAAIVRFDTKLKFTDKTRANFNSIFLDPEGNLGLPEISHVTTFYGDWNINARHAIGFSYFSVNRESSLFSIDETFEDIRLVGDVKITDTTNFYRLNYGYTLFNDERSKI